MLARKAVQQSARAEQCSKWDGMGSMEGRHGREEGKEASGRQRPHTGTSFFHFEPCPRVSLHIATPPPWRDKLTPVQVDI